jgi:alpha-tubulin suppressor-like RCC1 family protein
VASAELVTELATKTAGGDRWEDNRVQGSFSTLASGDHHSCAVTDGDNTALCWGENTDGQLGDGTIGGPDDCFGLNCKSTPVKVKDLDHITHIAAGQVHTCAVAGGKVYGWGNNAVGQIGATTSASLVACSNGDRNCVSTPTLVSLL